MNIELSCDYFTTSRTTSGQMVLTAENVYLSQTIDAQAILSQMDIKEIIEYVERQEFLVINKSAEAA